MASRLERVAQQRLEKLGRIRARGTNPYPRGYRRSHTAQAAIALLKKKEAGLTRRDKVNVAGRIMAHRNMGKITFIDLCDSSGKIQLLCGELLNADQNQLLKEIDIGDIIGAAGVLFRTKRGDLRETLVGGLKDAVFLFK